MIEMIKRLIIICLCVGLGQTTVRAKDTIRLNLQEAIEIGVSKSVDAMVVQNSYILSYWAFRNYRTEFLPEMTFSATLPNYSKSHNQFQNQSGEYSFVKNYYTQVDGEISVNQNIPWTGGKLSLETSLNRLKQKDRNASYYTVPFSVTLNQPLNGYNRLKWLKRIEPLRYGEATRARMSEMEEVAHTTIQYYFDLLLGQINLEIATQNLQNTEKMYAVSEAKRTIGQISEAELMQMQVNLLNARSSHIDAAASFDARMFQLRSFLGFDETVVLTPEIPEFPTHQVPQLPYDDVLHKARENNPFTYNIRRRMLEASRDVSKAKADRWGVNLFASFGYSGQQDMFPAAYKSSNWRDKQVVRIGAQIPILDWGKQKSKVEVARANLNIVKSQIEKEELDFDQDIYLRVQDFNRQPYKMLLAKEADEVAGKRYEITVEAFMQGKIEILNLNDSQSSKDMARRDYIEQTYLLWSYYYQIRSLTLYDYIGNRDLTQLYDLL